jgi:hypothetical protein
VNFLVLFLLFSFLAGGATWGQPLLRRPVVYLAICVVFAAAYYSIRVVQ